jgi:hypothetical protein
VQKLIGTNVTGTAALGNVGYGIGLGGPGNEIGDEPGERERHLGAGAS